MQTWKLQDAKARLSELVKEAAKTGPQEITLRGETVAVVLSKKDYEKLVSPKLSFIELMLEGSLA